MLSCLPISLQFRLKSHGMVCSYASFFLSSNIISIWIKEKVIWNHAYAVHMYTLKILSFLSLSSWRLTVSAVKDISIGLALYLFLYCMYGPHEITFNLILPVSLLYRRSIILNKGADVFHCSVFYNIVFLDTDHMTIYIQSYSSLLYNMLGRCLFLQTLAIAYRWWTAIVAIVGQVVQQFSY